MTTATTAHLTTQSITRAAAVELIAHARAAATEIGVDMAIAVTDSAGHLRAFEAMDGAPFLAHTVAIDKAWTAAAYRLPTHVWTAVVQQPDTAQLAQIPRLVAVGGGYPITVDGTVLGGLGLSGGNWEQDQRAAEAALRALGFDLPS